MNKLNRYSANPAFSSIEMPTKDVVNDGQRVGLYKTDNVNQYLGVRITGNPEAGVTIVRPMPATDEVGRIQLADDHGVYSAVTGACVIGVDFPGMGDGSSQLSKEQRQKLGQGTFRQVGDAQWKAIELALNEQGKTFRDLGRVVLWGASFGSNQVAGLWAAKPEDVDVSDLMMQMTPWQTPLTSLARGFAEASHDRDYYYDLDGENYHGRESDFQWLGRIWTFRKIGALITAATSMSRGGIMDDLSSRPLKSISIHIMNAEHDRISPTDDNLAAARHLEDYNQFVNYQLMNGEYHAIQQSRRVVGWQQRQVIGSSNELA